MPSDMRTTDEPQKQGKALKANKPAKNKLHKEIAKKQDEGTQSYVDN